MNLKLKRIELKNYDIKDDARQMNSYLNEISENNINSLKDKFIQNQVNYELFIEEIEN